MTSYFHYAIFLIISAIAVLLFGLPFDFNPQTKTGFPLIKFNYKPILFVCIAANVYGILIFVKEFT